MIMEKRNMTLQIKEMANFIIHSQIATCIYFDLNLNAIIIKLHHEAIYIHVYIY
jgi:hypothetical protein